MQFFTAGLLSISSCYAEVIPSALFSDHMVLQRDMPVPVWGQADPGESVTVSFSNQKIMTKADEQGEWMVKLKALEGSSQGREMKIEGSNQLVFKDVVVGEVWICSGQSNMQYRAGSVPEVKAMLPEAGDVRRFHVPCTVAFEEQRTLEGNWETEVADSAVAAGFSMLLEKSIDVPVGIILSAWGSSSLEAWMPRDMAEKLPIFEEQLKMLENDKEGQARIKAALDIETRSKQDDVFMRRQSNIVYNAMMKPLVPYACRGLVWYQGERNAFNFDTLPEEPWYRRSIPMTGYGNALKLWIERYRQEWEKDDFHFMIVMLPGYAGGIEDKAEAPDAQSWAWMRESQLEALEVPHTSIVNTIDLGDVKNIHPKDKFPIGERLVLLAQRDTLGMEVMAEGPVMKQVVQNNGQLVVHYHHVKGLKTKDGAAPNAFWLADDSGKWIPAIAKIEKDCVILHSPEIEKPLYVRYAFAGKPNTNLVNAAGLPARPFRTDKFAK